MHNHVIQNLHYKPEQAFLCPGAMPLLFTVVAGGSCDEVAGGGFNV